MFERPAGVPLRFMLQELGDDDQRTDVTAHLDLACGLDIATVTIEHRARGAHVVGTELPWTVLRDPVGITYCLTPRSPTTGRLA